MKIVSLFGSLTVADVRKDFQPNATWLKSKQTIDQ